MGRLYNFILLDNELKSVLHSSLAFLSLSDWDESSIKFLCERTTQNKSTGFYSRYFCNPFLFRQIIQCVNSRIQSGRIFQKCRNIFEDNSLFWEIWHITD